MINMRLICRKLYARLFNLGRMLFDFCVIAFGQQVETHDDRVCIVRIDAIGDYILFRQALRSLRFSPRLAGKKFVLCGNAAWQELAMVLDSDCFEQFIPVNRGLFDTSLRYRAKILLQVKSLGAMVAIQPTFSREYMGDILVAATRANERIGFHSLPQNITPRQKRITDKFYTELIEVHETYPFELMRNQQFLRYLRVPQQDIQPFHLDWTPRYDNNNAEDVRACCGLTVFFVGASQSEKRWPLEYWLELASRLERERAMPVVWLGGEDCIDEMLNIVSRLPAGNRNLVGRTDLLDVLEIVAAAPFVVTNDSMVLHIAAMLGIPCIGISNGQHLGRFLPYPEDVAHKSIAVYPAELSQELRADRQKYYYAASPFPIDSITVNRVYEALVCFLV
jgi:ADP-heptose:LPS heptosyltransferase